MQVDKVSGLSRHRQEVDLIMSEARQLPVAEQLTVNRARSGTVDITGAKAFLTSPLLRQWFVVRVIPLFNRSPWGGALMMISECHD